MYCGTPCTCVYNLKKLLSISCILYSVFCALCCICISALEPSVTWSTLSAFCKTCVWIRPRKTQGALRKRDRGKKRRQKRQKGEKEFTFSCSIKIRRWDFMFSFCFLFNVSSKKKKLFFSFVRLYELQDAQQVLLQ